MSKVKNEQTFIIINKFEYGKDLHLFEENEYFMKLFETYDEFFNFWNTLADTYPEGVPEEYIHQKLNQYATFKLLDALDELVEDGLVVKSQNEDGEDVWRIAGTV